MGYSHLMKGKKYQSNRLFSQPNSEKMAVLIGENSGGEKSSHGKQTHDRKRLLVILNPQDRLSVRWVIIAEKTWWNERSVNGYDS